MKHMLLSSVALVALQTAAFATTLASGPLSGGSTQATAVCNIFNSGTGPITVSTGQIIKEPNNVVTMSANCPAALPAGAMCGMTSAIAANAAHTCKFVLYPDGADIRGTFEIRNGNTVLESTPLR